MNEHGTEAGSVATKAAGDKSCTNKKVEVMTMMKRAARGGEDRLVDERGWRTDYNIAN